MDLVVGKERQVADFTHSQQKQRAREARHSIRVPFLESWHKTQQTNGSIVTGVGKALGRRFASINQDVATVPEELQTSVQNATEKLLTHTQKMSPLYILDQHTKAQIKGKVKENWTGLTRLALEASLYCALFHHTKEGAKHMTRGMRRAGPVVSYVSDVMLPTPLFGPIVGLVVRFAV
ncbi:hypothetical protein WJX72_001522 [[Myrmecia] bisecta]|uniref:Uncharacterized protein n=1 Tax=[Myrmecia] bisecta TaxID=41462 RepID=A0AAW1PT46_9CHLO